jgi:hypothetical protein
MVAVGEITMYECVIAIKECPADAQSEAVIDTFQSFLEVLVARQIQISSPSA